MKYMEYCSPKTGLVSTGAAILLLLLLTLQSNTASAITVGQSDTFSDGTLQSWEMGSTLVTLEHLVNIADGGPAGAGDNYLNASSHGINPDGTITGGSRLTFFNQAQWTGDYTAAGVTSISMDVINLGTDPLDLTLAVNGGVIDPVTGVTTGGLFATTTSVTLDPGSGWTTVVFSFLASDFTAVSGKSGETGKDINATLANVTELRIINSNTPSWNGTPVVATLGIDNITAVPLPAAVWMFASGLVMLGAFRRRTG